MKDIEDSKMNNLNKNKFKKLKNTDHKKFKNIWLYKLNLGGVKELKLTKA